MEELRLSSSQQQFRIVPVPTGFETIDMNRIVCRSSFLTFSSFFRRNKTFSTIHRTICQHRSGPRPGVRNDLSLKRECYATLIKETSTSKKIGIRRGSTRKTRTTTKKWRGLHEVGERGKREGEEGRAGHGAPRTSSFIFPKCLIRYDD